MRLLLAIACIASAAAKSCADFHNDCAGCLAHKWLMSKKKCAFCARVDVVRRGDSGVGVSHGGLCTSKPEEKCAYKDGWSVVKYAGKTKGHRDTESGTRAKCAAFKAELTDQARAIDVMNTEAKDARLMAKGGTRKGLHYGKSPKFGTSKYGTEKAGTVITLDSGVSQRLHLSLTTRKYWIGAQRGIYQFYEHLVKDLPIHKRLSRAAFLGRVFGACRATTGSVVDVGDLGEIRASVRDHTRRWEEVRAALNAAVGVAAVQSLTPTFARHCLNLGAGGVKYLRSARDREPYEYVLVGGRLVKKSHPDQLLSTCGMRTHERKGGWAIFVVAPSGAIFTNSHTVGRFHHSSFLAGGPIKAAGEWLVKDGKILAISDKTGHYKNGAAHLAAFLAQLHAGGADGVPAEGLLDAPAAHFIPLPDDFEVAPEQRQDYCALPVRCVLRLRESLAGVSYTTLSDRWDAAIKSEATPLNGARKRVQDQLSKLKDLPCNRGGPSDTSALRRTAGHPLMPLPDTYT